MFALNRAFHFFDRNREGLASESPRITEERSEILDAARSRCEWGGCFFPLKTAARAIEARTASGAGTLAVFQAHSIIGQFSPEPCRIEARRGYVVEGTQGCSSAGALSLPHAAHGVAR